MVVSLLCLYSCYYTSRVCKYFIDGECYENHITTNNASECSAVHGGYFLSGRCYYHVPPNCSAGQYYQQCMCYPHRSSTYSNSTCINIGGFHTDNYCYYVDFSCRGYAVNDQCYTRVIKKLRCFSKYNDASANVKKCVLHFSSSKSNVHVIAANRPKLMLVSLFRDMS